MILIILNDTYLYRFFCSKFKSFHSKQGPKYYLLTHILPRFYQHILPVHRSNLNIITTFLMGFLSNCDYVLLHWASFDIKRKKSEAKNNHLCKQKVAKIKTDEWWVFFNKKSSKVRLIGSLYQKWFWQTYLV